jgi:hypothetical protein
MRPHRAAALGKHVQIGPGGHGGDAELFHDLLDGDSALLLDDFLDLLAAFLGQHSVFFGYDLDFHSV